ncbi:MAG: molybdenum ABC transporter ATP-binding protein [Alteromonadaceae bacterium]|nr:MAG: molybdenum ABC transporter ATP-binding protein [Alteromonadaceae bacterium]
MNNATPPTPKPQLTPKERIIELRNASVYRSSTQVFSGINLTLNTGENTVILGANGAGKTTLLKLFTRELWPVVAPDSYLKIFGEERITIWELRKKIGIVSHEYQNAHQTLASGLEVVLSAFFGAVGIHQHHTVTDSMREQALQCMETLQLKSLADKRFIQLSAGQQRRLLLARALVHKPKVLIFDEPTSGLDMRASFELIEQLRTLSQNGTTLILVTHHIQEIIPEISRVVALKSGRILFDDLKENVMKDALISQVFDTPVSVIEKNDYYQVLPRPKNKHDT